MTVEDEAIGTLDGFRFMVDADARAATSALMLAAAETPAGRRARRKRGQALAAADDAATCARCEGGARSSGNGSRSRGSRAARTLLAPAHRARPRARALLDAGARRRARVGSTRWLDGAVARHLPPLAALDAAARDRRRGRAAARAARRAARGRRHRASARRIGGSSARSRKRASGCARLGVTDRRARPVRARAAQAEPLRWLRRSRWLRAASPPRLPPEGATVLAARRRPPPASAASATRRCGRSGREASPAPRTMPRAGPRAPSRPIPRSRPRSASTPDTLARLMRARLPPPARSRRPRAGVWRGRPRRPARPTARRARGNAFAALAALGRQWLTASHAARQLPVVRAPRQDPQLAQAMAERRPPAPRRPRDRPRACRGRASATC